MEVIGENVLEFKPSDKAISFGWVELSSDYFKPKWEDWKLQDAEHALLGRRQTQGPTA